MEIGCIIFKPVEGDKKNINSEKGKKGGKGSKAG